MGTYLAICQDVARESGVVAAPDSPTTVTGQVGQLRRLVGWVSEAYRRIQLTKDWRWLQAEFSGETIAGVQEYRADALGITSRFSKWLRTTDDNQNFPVTRYLTSLGRTDEQELIWIEWNDFKRRFLIGSAATSSDPPSFYTIDPTDRLRFYPIPDDIYTIRGEYMKSPQILTSDGDIPEMPEQFHDLIKWRALMLLGKFDEAFELLPYYQIEHDQIDALLQHKQIPAITMGGALA